MADNLVGRPQLNLHKISTDQLLRTLLSYNPVLFFPAHWVKVSQRCCWAIIRIGSFMIRGCYWSSFSTYKVIVWYWKWYFWPVSENKYHKIPNLSPSERAFEKYKPQDLFFEFHYILSQVKRNLLSSYLAVAEKKQMTFKFTFSQQ